MDATTVVQISTLRPQGTGEQSHLNPNDASVASALLAPVQPASRRSLASASSTATAPSKNADTRPADPKDSRHTQRPVRSGVVPLWLTTRDACELLDVSVGALKALVQARLVARIEVAGSPRFRLIRRHDSREVKTFFGPAADDAGLGPKYKVALVALVDQLTQRLVAAETRAVRLEAERNEALQLAREMTVQARAFLAEATEYADLLLDALDQVRAGNRLAADVYDLAELVCRVD